jgi:hypothetical protein
MSRRRMTGVALTLCMAGGNLFLTANPGYAACGNKEQYFIVAQNDSGIFVDRKGTQATILMRNRDLDQDCGGNPPGSGSCGFSVPFTVSTAHLRPGLSGVDQSKIVEIGWAELWATGDTSTQAESKKNWYVFSRKYVDGNCTQARNQLAPNLDPGTTDLWRITGVDKPNGTTDWNLEVNFQLGGGWVLFEIYNTNWNKGFPMAETERLGDHTGMAEDQTGLRWLNLGNWADWADNGCWRHIDQATSEWDYVRRSNNSFDLLHQGADAC